MTCPFRTPSQLSLYVNMLPMPRLMLTNVKDCGQEAFDTAQISYFISIGRMIISQAKYLDFTLTKAIAQTGT